MFFAVVFIDLLKFFRRLFNAPIDCPWCFCSLDDDMNVFERACPVDTTMKHAETCVSYKGFLREPKEGLVWQLPKVVLIRGQKARNSY